MLPLRKSYRSCGVSDEKPTPTRKGGVRRCHKKKLAGSATIGIVPVPPVDHEYCC
jgi:hypothetical protein